MFVIPGLLLAIEGPGRWFILPTLVHWAYIHLVSITYISDLCVVMVRWRIKGTHHHQPLPA